MHKNVWLIGAIIFCVLWLASLGSSLLLKSGANSIRDRDVAGLNAYIDDLSSTWNPTFNNRPVEDDFVQEQQELGLALVKERYEHSINVVNGLTIIAWVFFMRSLLFTIGWRKKLNWEKRSKA